MPISLREKVGNWIGGKKAGGTDWFVNFMRLAAEEDSAGEVTITNAYKLIAWVNIAISARARNLSRAEFKIYKGEDTEVEQGPEWQLFNSGFAGKSKYQLWEETEGWRCIRGEAIWILGWGGLEAKQIVIVDPADMKHYPSKDGMSIVGWEYLPAKIPFKPEEIIHFPMWNPYERLRGMSELEPIRDEIAQEYLASKSNMKLLQNSSIPGGVITIPGDSTSAEEAAKVVEQWEKKHRGVNRAGRVAVLGSGATYARISLSPEEMQSAETRGWNRDTILAKFGVPQAAVGLKNATSTLSGKDTMEQMKAFWELTLIPECKYFEEKLNSDFFAKRGLDLTCEFDLDDIPELQQDAKELHDRLRTDIQAGLLTINEARETLGMDPVAWGDTWWLSIALQPADTAMEPPEPEQPEPESEQPPEKPLEMPAKTKAKSRPVVYTPAYRDAHWKAVVDPWERIEGQYTKKLRSWVYDRRKYSLENLHSFMESGNEWILTDEPMWFDANKKLQNLSKPFFAKVMDLESNILMTLFRDIGLEVSGSWSVWDTRAKEKLDFRVNKGSLNDISETIRQELRGKIGDAIQYGWTEDELADSIRGIYNKAQNRAPMIARTELGGAINDSRVEGFKDVGIQHHEWLSAKDERVRDTHRIDGEVVQIGDRFSNGLLYPNDPSGDAAEVINCRCITLPVFGEESR